MSLTSQLHQGELARWCAERLPGTGSVVRSVARAGGGRQPVRPDGEVQPYHWAAVGGTLGVRLALLVQPAPPYYSLLGLAGGGIVSRRWADATAAEFPTHHRLTGPEQARALQLRPTPAGWLDLGPGIGTGVNDIPPEEEDAMQQRLLSDFFGILVRTLADRAPAGQLPTPAVEETLLRTCYVLSSWEDVYRSATLVDTLLALHERGSFHMEELRQTAPQRMVTELLELVELVRTGGVLKQWRDLAGHPGPGLPLGIAGPVIVDNWADADLLIGPPGKSAPQTLVDVKTVLRLDQPDRTARWLWQILGYAWLDLPGRWNIESVALHFARHGFQLTWPVDELAEELAAPGTSLPALRDEFREVATRALTTEGAHLPT